MLLVTLHKCAVRQDADTSISKSQQGVAPCLAERCEHAFMWCPRDVLCQLGQHMIYYAPFSPDSSSHTIRGIEPAQTQEVTETQLAGVVMARSLCKQVPAKSLGLAGRKGLATTTTNQVVSARAQQPSSHYTPGCQPLLLATHSPGTRVVFWCLSRHTRQLPAHTSTLNTEHPYTCPSRKAGEHTKCRC